MIIQSLLIISVIFDLVGLNSLSTRLDNAIIKDRYAQPSQVTASAKDTRLPEILPRPKLKSNPGKPAILAKHYLLADKQTKKIFLKESANTRVPIASTTKVMTAVVALEYYELSDIVTVSTEASTQVGADVYLRPGEQITVGELVKGLLIKSGNDAAYALAEHMNQPGEQGTKKFVAKMNEKAKELGLADTDYHDPAGLDVTGYSSAYDLFLIASYALDKPYFAQIVRTDQASARNLTGDIWHELKNSNRLVGEYKYPGAIGVKTGYMPEAGHVLVSAAEREGHTLIGVVIDTYADTAPASADESRKLLDWGFTNIVW